MANIVDVISGFELFKGSSIEELKTLADLMSFEVINQDDIFIHEHQEDSAAFFLVSGKLSVFIKDDVTKQNIQIDEILPGEIVGEIAFFANKPRIASVKAIHESVLLKFNKRVLHAIQNHHELIFDNILTIAINRALFTAQFKKKRKVKIISIVPAANSKSTFAQKIVSDLLIHKRTLLIDSNIRKHHRANTEEVHHFWKELFLSEFDHVFYELDGNINLWTQYCLDRSDLIFLCAENHASPKILNNVENKLFSSISNYINIELILRCKNVNCAYEASEWLEKRPVHNYHLISQKNGYNCPKLKESVFHNFTGINDAC